jgi:hypothetical protein
LPDFEASGLRTRTNPVAAAEVEDAFVALQAQIGQRTLCDKLLLGV